MSGLEALAIVAAVAAVVSAFNDGNKLVRQIKDKRKAKKAPLPPSYLEESLELGPRNIEAQYHSGLEDFGEEFADGDQITINRLKDIEIELLRTLLAHLRRAVEDDTMIDFKELERASNRGRVQAVKALCELYERLDASAGTGDLPLPRQIKAQQYQHSASLQTTSHIPQWSMDTLSSAVQEQSLLDRISQTATSQAPWGPNSYGEPPIPGVPTFRTLPALTSQTTLNTTSGTTFYTNTPNEELHIPKRSEKARDIATPLQDFKRRKTSFLSKFMRTPSDESDGRPPIRPARSDSPFGTRAEVDESLGSAFRSQSDGPKTQSRPGTQVAEEGETGFDELTENVWGEGESGESPTTSIGPARTMSGSRTSDVEEVEPHYTNRFYPQQAAKLILPSADNSYGGFCEGAWRMQIGDPKGGMKRRQDVGPGASTYYFWKCVSKQCAFNGEMFGTKKCPSFDPKVRVSKTGIRFRWSFLAKSHITQSKVVNSQYNYGCIFCCIGKDPTPVFRGIDTLLEHLLTHKGQGIPAQALHRAGCVVDRLCTDSEEFDINLPPFAGMMGK